MISKIKKQLLCSDLPNRDFNKFIKLKKRIVNAKTPINKWWYLRKYNLIMYKNNTVIPFDAIIGENLVMPHGLSGVFISQGAKIGNNCVIFQQVTIGSNTLSDSKKKGSPIIGNNVYIGAGARIIGNVKIGNNVRIGANAVVVTDIPDNCTVVGEKSRIISHENELNNRFYSYNEIIKK